MSRSAIWQIMWYTCAALALAVAAGYVLLGAAGVAKLYLVVGAAVLQFVSWSTRRRRRAAEHLAIKVAQIQHEVGGESAVIDQEAARASNSVVVKPAMPWRRRRSRGCSATANWPASTGRATRRTRRCALERTHSWFNRSRRRLVH